MYILDVDRQSAEETVELIRSEGGKAWFYASNVVSRVEVIDTFQKIYEKDNRLDILVNNAGILKYQKVTETPEKDWDLLLNVNVKGAFLCANHAIPYMLKQDEGVVIIMSSVQAFVASRKGTILNGQPIRIDGGIGSKIGGGGNE